MLTPEEGCNWFGLVGILSIRTDHKNFGLIDLSLIFK